MDNLPATREQTAVAPVNQQLIDRWQQWLDLASTSESTYERGVARFIQWLNGRDATGATVRQWRDAELAAGNKPTSVNTWLSGVRSFFAWAVESGHIEASPAAAVRSATRRGTSHRHKRDELTGGEIRRVLASCDDTPAGRRDHAMLALMTYCALRQVEVHRADIGDLRTKDGRLVLWVQGKGHVDKDDFVVLPEAAETAVSEWLAVHPGGDGALFIGLGNRSSGRRLSTRAIRGIVQERYRAAGVAGDAKTTHSLRHSAISSAIRNGAAVQQVQAMARHANINTTMIYYHETGRTSNPAEDLIKY